MSFQTIEMCYAGLMQTTVFCIFVFSCTMLFSVLLRLLLITVWFYSSPFSSFPCFYSCFLFIFLVFFFFFLFLFFLLPLFSPFFLFLFFSFFFSVLFLLQFAFIALLLLLFRVSILLSCLFFFCIFCIDTHMRDATNWRINRCWYFVCRWPRRPWA